MGYQSKKDELRREIARRERELERLEALPDFESMGEGVVLGLSVTLGRSQPYSFIAYKIAGLWHLTGRNSPSGVSGEYLADWLSTGGRRLQSFSPLATWAAPESAKVILIDLGDMLDQAQEQAINRYEAHDEAMAARSDGYEG